VIGNEYRLVMLGGGGFGRFSVSSIMVPVRGLAAVLSVGLLLLTGCGGVDSSLTERESAAEKLAFQATTVEGKSFDGTSLIDRDVVLYFWAPWCPVCRDEIRDIAAVAKEFEGRGMRVIGVASLGDLSAMTDFVTDTGTEELTHLADIEGTIWSRFGVTRQYTAAFVDDGGSVEVVSGPFTREDLENRVTALLEK